MEKANREININIVRRVLVVVFCLFIVISMAYVMLNVYNPAKNSLAALASTSLDIVCSLILMILVGNFIFENYGLNKTSRLFSGLLIATIWALFLDFLNWAFDGSLSFDSITGYFTIGSLCMGAIMTAIFCYYLYCYMNEVHELSDMQIPAMVCVGLNFISFLITFFLAISGTAFTFVDGHYETGVLYDVVEAAPILTLLYLTGYVVYNVKKVGVHDVVAAAGYILFMISGALIEATFVIGTTYVAVAIADIFIFVMLQNEIIAQEKRNVKKWMKRSNTDELTGLYNRHAYENDLKTLEENGIDNDFVFVSMDVNSLKMVNDNYGHAAGDELLVGATMCLKKTLGKYGKLYRLGGDEFIAIIYADNDQLNMVKTEVEKACGNWHGTLIDKLSVSFGYVTKKEARGMSMKEIANLADQRMYEAKNEYYRSSGIDRRKKF